MKTIVNGKIYINENFVEKNLVFTDSIIEITDSIPENSEIIDAKNNYVLPGFIDVHVHGYGGNDTMEGTKESLENIQRKITQNGVTSFLPTTMTMDLEKIEKALENIKACKNNNIGARILGAHLEGPFINSKYKGAQPEEFIIDPNIKLMEKYRDIIKICTVAPEKEGSLEMIEMFPEVNFSLGHSGCTYDQAIKAYEKGAKSTTHLFNAMTPLHHREPGLVGAALTADCYCELIADTIHVNKNLFDFIIKNKTMDKLLLITDCMEAGGLEDGEYSLGGQKVIVENGKCMLKSGTIAGSTLKLIDGLKNLTTYSKKDLVDTIKAVTINQSKYLGIDNIGTLNKGNLADIVIMDDKYNIVSTFVGGER
ncbi:MAG: N-acetylglucosamine-6-phosphate deacetylase [Lachnospirales bacterium]